MLLLFLKRKSNLDAHFLKGEWDNLIKDPLVKISHISRDDFLSAYEFPKKGKCMDMVVYVWY